MAPPRNFSAAEVETVLAIIKRFGGMVSAPCLGECQAKLGRYVSAPTLRTWWRESLKPKRSHHVKRPENSTDPAPLLGEVDENAELSAKPEDLAGLDFVQKIERLLDKLVDRAHSPEQIALISGVQLLKAIGGLIDQWLKLKHLDPAIVELAP